MERSDQIIHPRLYHYGLITGKLEEMQKWYATVVGMSVVFKSDHPLGASVPLKVGALWVSNDEANHRIGIIGLPNIHDDTNKSAHSRMHHIAYEYNHLDDLLYTYKRLKDLQIMPLIVADHGATTSMYYADPDGNIVELAVDNFGDAAISRTFMQESPQFAEIPMGYYVDPEKLIVARENGENSQQIHERGYKSNSDFLPDYPVDPRVIM